MFLMRRAKVEDVSTLLKLAKMVHFINLPADKDIITDKASWSRQCFAKAARLAPTGSVIGADAKSSKRNMPAQRGRTTAGSNSVRLPTQAQTSDPSGLASAITRSDLFMFVLEDVESAGVLGTSQIISRMGGPGAPNVSFQLSRREMFSQSLQIGATHTVAKLVLDESGPTEIGGLILQPSYRGHKAKLGRFLSLVRFHFAGLFPELFADRVIAEMMGPLTPDGRNTLWEYLGRRFINLTYPEADSFCQYSKEFMIALLPREEIYLTLLPPEARSVIAQVGPETVPARKMLEKLGFEYRDRIDPFDGGPTLEAKTREIVTVAQTRRLVVGEPMSVAEGDEVVGQAAIVSTLDSDGEFRALNVPVIVEAESVRLRVGDMELLGASKRGVVGVTVLDERKPGRFSKAESGRAEVGKKKRGRGK